MQVTAVSNKANSEQVSVHPCLISPSPCSHLCIQVENESFLDIRYTYDFNTNYTCRCPTDMIIDTDKKTCIKPVQCDENQFFCYNSNKCVDQSRECNGQIDCPKGEDEIKCEGIIFQNKSIIFNY